MSLNKELVALLCEARSSVKLDYLRYERLILDNTTPANLTIYHGAADRLLTLLDKIDELTGRSIDND